MDADKFKHNIEEWLALSNRGLFVEARKFYFDNLFENIIDNFVSKTAPDYHCDVLFSILGFSPEPIILTQRALMPSVHVIFTTNKDKDSDNEIMAYLEKFLTSSYKIVHLKDEELQNIHNTLKNQMQIYPASRYVIDITGGKKSMVASASIFGRNYNCDVVYVDYDQYIPELRRPMPGTEKLDIVYSVQRDFVELLGVDDLKKKKKKKTVSKPQQIIQKSKVTFFEAYSMLKKAIEKEEISTSKVRLEYNDTKGEELVLLYKRISRKVSRNELQTYLKNNPNPTTSDQFYFGNRVGSEDFNELMVKVIKFMRKKLANI